MVQVNAKVEVVTEVERTVLLIIRVVSVTSIVEHIISVLGNMARAGKELV